MSMNTRRHGLLQATKVIANDMHTQFCVISSKGMNPPPPAPTHTDHLRTPGMDRFQVKNSSPMVKQREAFHPTCLV